MPYINAVPTRSKKNFWTGFCYTYLKYLGMSTYKKNYDNTTICWRCHQALDTRIARSFILKTLFFWLPIKAYFCQKCLTKRYVMSFKDSEGSLGSL